MRMSVAAGGGAPSAMPASSSSLGRFAYVATAPHAPPVVLGEPRELLERVERGGHALLVLNFDPPVRADPRWGEVFEALERLDCRVLLHATAASEDYLPLLDDRRFVRNLIAKNDEPLEPEELIASAGKLLSGDLFGLDKYLLW